MIEHHRGVITRIETRTEGRLAGRNIKGIMDVPVIIHHGGRARAIEKGELNIDVALGVSSCDEYGNKWLSRKSIWFLACNRDANYAKKVLITDNWWNTKFAGKHIPDKS